MTPLPFRLRGLVVATALSAAALPAARASTVATPSFSPAAGSYSSAQSVTISTTTTGATIRYTTDGSTPSHTVGTVYSAPVNIAVTTTLKAIAYKTGMTDSAVKSGTYTINLPTVATPTFSPAAGTYTSPQTVTISTTTTGATIRYTTDGSTPSQTVGTVYSTPVSISTTTTLKAIAYKSGYNNSTVASGTYTISLQTVATPTFSPAAGTYTSPQSVTISTTTTGATIRYTTDGSTPSQTVGTVYSSAVSIAASTTLKAIAYKTGYNNSAVASGTYTINLPTVATPTFNPAAGTYTSPQSVVISTTTTGATIRYTTDGSTPSQTVGTVYSTPVNIAVTTTLQAIAYKTNYNNSSVRSGTYTINIAPPVINSTTTANGQTGTAFSYQITATHSPTSYSATGLPPGLSVNTSTGLISGTTTRPGVVSVTIGATNAGGTGTATLTLTILATLPYSTDFEPADGYTLGSLHNQLGWSVAQGTAQVSTADAFSGTQSALLAAGNPPASITQSFANTPVEGIVFVDFFAKPVANADLALATTFTVEGAHFGFAQSGGLGTLRAYNGDGAGGGTWSPTTYVTTLGAGNQTQGRSKGVRF